MRWADYVLKRGEEVGPFWADLLRGQSRNVLFILGRGFDPRMCLGLESVMGAGGDGRRDCLLVHFENGQRVSRRETDLIEQNLRKLESLLGSTRTMAAARIEMREDRIRSVASPNTRRVFLEQVDVGSYDDIVVDVSAMPRVIGLTGIAVLLKRLDDLAEQTGRVVGLHVMVAENPTLDQKIGKDTEREMTEIVGFSSRPGEQSTAAIPLIWLPILGEGRKPHIQRLHEKLNPNEICPVLPSPSRNPRRGDDIVLEYRELLFESRAVEPTNIVYAAEQHPFEAYRQIYRTIERYNTVLEPIGGVRSVVSPLSSKLLSLGALLACYELKEERQFRVGISWVESRNYRMPDEEIDVSDVEPFSLWMAGECYQS